MPCCSQGNHDTNFLHDQVMEGDSVTVEMSPFDLTKGRIVFRSPPAVRQYAHHSLPNIESTISNVACLDLSKKVC